MQGKTYELLQIARAALVKSGASTLEAALFDVPQVVCYAGNRLSYLIAKQLIQVKYISLVNLVADKPLVKELIQDELNPQNLKRELGAILESNTAVQMKRDYQDLRQQLGSGRAPIGRQEKFWHFSTLELCRANRI